MWYIENQIPDHQSHLWVAVLLEQSNMIKECYILFVNYGAFINCQTNKIMHFTEPLSKKMQYNLPIMSASAWMKKTTDVDGIWNLLKRLMRRQMCCFNVGSSPAETATVDGSNTRLKCESRNPILTWLHHFTLSVSQHFHFRNQTLLN